MKDPHSEIERLLNDLLPVSINHVGPNRSEIQELVVRDRQRKSSLHLTLTSVAAIFIVGFAASFWATPKTPPTPIAVTIRAPLVESRQINDEELLALLGDVPAALMEWPNGKRTLLVIGR